MGPLISLSYPIKLPLHNPTSQSNARQRRFMFHSLHTGILYVFHETTAKSPTKPEQAFLNIEKVRFSLLLRAGGRYFWFEIRLLCRAYCTTLAQHGLAWGWGSVHTHIYDVCTGNKDCLPTRALNIKIKAEPWQGEYWRLTKWLCEEATA